MRFLRRRDDVDVADADDGDDVDTSSDRVVTEPVEVIDRSEVVSYRWTPGSIVAVLAGGALATFGVVALTRTEINSTWYSPVAEVANVSHTPLLAAIQVGVGAVVVLLALAGARLLTALVCMATAVAAAVVAIDPGEVRRELAMERSWAIGIAAVAAAVAVLLLPPWPAKVERREEPRYQRRRTWRRPVGQS
jgi:lysylphosphatidylglycerol synthetase-like protein (DUF2156 family)